MSLRSLRSARRSFFFAPWHIILLLTALLALSSCALNPPAASETKTPPQITITPPIQTESPYKPGPDAAQAISDCNSLAAPGGCFSPEQVQTFYNLNPLYAQGFTGKGQT